MNKQFLEWLEKQKYDWNVYYNNKHRRHGGRIWMLKSIYNHVYREHSFLSYRWDEMREYDE